jgi:hypothetical protein
LCVTHWTSTIDIRRHANANDHALCHVLTPVSSPSALFVRVESFFMTSLIFVPRHWRTCATSVCLCLDASDLFHENRMRAFIHAPTFPKRLNVSVNKCRRYGHLVGQSRQHPCLRNSCGYFVSPFFSPPPPSLPIPLPVPVCLFLCRVCVCTTNAHTVMHSTLCLSVSPYLCLSVSHACSTTH